MYNHFNTFQQKTLDLEGGEVSISHWGGRTHVQ